MTRIDKEAEQTGRLGRPALDELRSLFGGPVNFLMKGAGK